MAFPTTVASTGAATPASNTTSHAITLPTHAAGDLLVVAFTAHSHATHTPSGTGWSSNTVTNGFDVVRHSVFTKIATSASETLTITTSAATQSSHRARSIRAGSGMALEVAVGPSGTGYSSNTYYGDYSPPAGLQDYLSIATVGNDGSTQYTGIDAPFTGFLSTPGASSTAASTGIASANEATTTTSIAQFTGSPTDVDWCGFPIVVWEVDSGGTDGTATGATVSVASSLVPGSAAGTRNPTQAGQTLTVTSSLVPGTATGARNGTAAGVVLTVTASLTAGAASANRNPTQAGQVLAVATSLIAGAASAVANPTQAGVTLTVGASLLAGSASGGGSVTAAGVLLSIASSLVAGTASGVRNPTQVGRTFAVAASLLAGSAAGQRQPTQVGRTFTVASSLIAGTATAQTSVTAPGQTWTVASSLVPGAATGVASATAVGVVWQVLSFLVPGIAESLSIEPSVYRAFVRAEHRVAFVLAVQRYARVPADGNHADVPPANNVARLTP